MRLSYYQNLCVVLFQSVYISLLLWDSKLSLHWFAEAGPDCLISRSVSLQWHPIRSRGSLESGRAGGGDSEGLLMVQDYLHRFFSQRPWNSRIHAGKSGFQRLHDRRSGRHFYKVSDGPSKNRQELNIPDASGRKAYWERKLLLWMGIRSITESISSSIW